MLLNRLKKHWEREQLPQFWKTALQYNENQGVPWEVSSWERNSKSMQVNLEGNTVERQVQPCEDVS